MAYSAVVLRILLNLGYHRFNRQMMTMKRSLVAAFLICSGCAPQQRERPAPADSARRAFGDTAAAMLLDTTLYEMRAHLFVKVPNPSDPESQIRDSVVPHAGAPGPHSLDGKIYAELGVLQDLLGRSVPVRVDTARDHVFVGNPPVLLMGHQHGDAMYVPVKLFARQFGAYTDVGCTFASCAHIWPRSIIDFMIQHGAIGGAGILEGHAEGIVRNIDVTRLPTG
jgi:hypothetical protein